MARHWLDVVRYGESDGYERNIIRPNAWPYRDYVIRAFNKDLPYTQFVAEQLAGDTVGKGDPNVEAATGFLVAGIHDTVGNATEEGTRQQRINDLEDITSTTGAAFLGLTVGCARCHDHKFDPIPQRDFYRLASVFAGVRFGERTIISGPALAKVQAAKADIASHVFFAINELNELDDHARLKLFPNAARPAVNARRNVDSFSAVTARYVRFTVLATRDGAEPCIDELQIYGPVSSEVSSPGKPASKYGAFEHAQTLVADGRLQAVPEVRNTVANRISPSLSLRPSEKVEGTLSGSRISSPRPGEARWQKSRPRAGVERRHRDRFQPLAWL